MKGFKFIETLEVTFNKETCNSKTGERENIYKTAFFNGKTKTIAKASEIESELSMSQQEILNTIDIWVSEGSGWTIDKIDSNYVNIVVYQPLNESSYIELPDELKNSAKGLINIKSKETFEDQMNLLLITEDEKKHYVLIKDFDKFTSTQSRHKERKHFCMYCLQCFSSESILEKHTNNCLIINGKQAINMPKEGENILKFNNFHKQQAVSFVIYAFVIYAYIYIYADFEAITKKVQGCKPNYDKSYTEAYQTHEDCGYGYKVVCCYDDKYSKPIQTYQGENTVYEFMEKMLEEVEHCKCIVKKRFNKPLKMTENDKLRFKQMDECHICGNRYTDKDVRVRDHCHITVKFRDSVHQECNLRLKITPESIKVPVVFHNLRGYDSHLIMQQINEIAKNHAYKNKKGEEQHLKISAIPNNMEKYMAFMLGNHLNFIDSFQFMSSSLDKLVSNLPKELFKYTSEEFTGDKLSLMSQKGVYPCI